MLNRTMRPILLATAVIVLLTLVWFTRRVLLLLFAGVLISIILTSLTALLRRFLPVRQTWALALVLLLLAGIGIVVGFLAAGPVTSQANQLVEQLPKAFGRLTERIKEWSPLDNFEEALPDVGESLPSATVGKLPGVFSSTFEAASGLVFVIFTALFLAANPALYKKMLLKLVSPRYQSQAEAVLEQIVCTLKLWLGGQAFSMAIVGILTGVALTLAGVPFSIALGVFAGLAEFVPIVGPLIAAVPALLIAFTEGTDKVMVVAAIMLGIQFIESNLMMPLVQKRAVDLPPIVTLTSAFVLGAAFGLLGMFVATPLAVVILVLADELYVRRYLRSDGNLLETRCSS